MCDSVLMAPLGAEARRLTPLAQTLAAVAVEAGALAAVSDRMQVLISAALTADARANDGHLREFQALDLLTQRLNGISAFMEALSKSAPVDWAMDADAAAAGVTLSDLAARLKGAAGPAAAPTGDDGGELELFG